MTLFKMFYFKMYFSWILILFLVSSETLHQDEEEISKYVEIIEEFHSFYNFNEILIISPHEEYQNEELINRIMKIPEMTFNTVSIKYTSLMKIESSYDFNNERKLVLYVVLASQPRILYDFNILRKSRVKMIITLKPIKNLESAINSADYLDTVIIANGSLYKYEYHRRNKFSSTTVPDFYSNDSFNYPEANLPRLKARQLGYNNHLYFPLIIYKSGSFSGLVGYTVMEFINRFNSRLERKLGFEYNQTNEVYIYIGAKTSTKILRRSVGGYPVMQCSECFILPVLDEILTGNFIKQPFTASTWISILITLFFLTASLRVLIFKDLFYTFYESLSITFGSVQKGLIASTPRNHLIYLMLYLYGFIISNIHLSILSSYLTAPYLGKQINTIPDVKKNNITLWVSADKVLLENGLAEIINYREHELKGFLSGLMDLDSFYRNLEAFDSRRGYLVSGYRWSYINHRQSLLKKKIFTFSDICVERGFVFPFINMHITTLSFLGVFGEQLTWFSMIIKESGLDYIWELKTYQEVKFRYIRKQDSIDWMILGFEYFSVAWWIYCPGMVFSLITFVLELIIARASRL